MQFVDVKVHENIGTVLMNRPEAVNALNPQMLSDLTLAFSDLHQEKRVQAVVLSANGDHFCAGMDLRVLNEIAELPEAEALQQWFTAWNSLNELLQSMLRFPKPIIAAVDGGALGAGFGLALAADMIVASDRAKFAAVAIRRGLVGGSTGALLHFRAGAAIAARMMLTGLEVTSDETYRLGLTQSPVPPDQIWVQASELAISCTDAPREAVQATKRALNEGVGEALLSQLSAGAADSATACTTESAREGIKAFIERREPNWES